MALAAYGRPRWLDEFRDAVKTTPEGGFVAEPLEWSRFAPAVVDGEAPGALHAEHADLAASMQTRLEEVLLDLARWLHQRTGEHNLTMAGGVALNCVANARLAEQGPFERVWVQPAAGDAGTALGAALLLSAPYGVSPMRSAALGPEWSDAELESVLSAARVPHQRPPDVADAAAAVLQRNGIVAWFQGRSEYGPRALGHRSLLAHPGHADNVQRLNEVKGREQFRPVAPMVLAERAAEIFTGQLPSPYMLFTHRTRAAWRSRIPAAVHVDGSARVQTVDHDDEPLVARLLERFEFRTGLPALINTSFNTAGRPMVDSPRDALECFGSAPIDALVMGPFISHRCGASERA
jgi:carbamoyltransferase